MTPTPAARMLDLFDAATGVGPSAQLP